MQGPRSLVALVGALEESWASKRKKEKSLVEKRGGTRCRVALGGALAVDPVGADGGGSR